jgi:hypothetical protein
MRNLIPSIGPHAMRAYDVALGPLYLAVRLAPHLVLAFVVAAVVPAGLLALAILGPQGGPLSGSLLVAAALTGYVAFFYFFAAVILEVDNYLNRRSSNLLQLFRRLRGTLFFRILGAGLLQSAIVVVAILPIYLVEEPVSPSGGESVMFVLQAAVVLAVWVFAIVSVIFVQPAVVLHQKGPLEAVAESWRLARGLRFRVALVTGGFYLLLALAYQGLRLTHSLIAPASGDPIPELIMAALLLPLVSSFPVLLYYDARDRHGRLVPAPQPGI